jgi:hypothetical protein
MMSAFVRGQKRARVGVGLMLVIAVCGACHSGTPTRPSEVPPAVAHLVGISWEPDWNGAWAQIDSDGAHLLDWGAGWYCVWLNNIPPTPADHCREYTFTFSWLPDVVSLPQFWSGATWSRGCRTYPNQSNAGACFQSPARNSVSTRQSITIVGSERTSTGTETETFRTEIAIRFRER